MCFVIINQNPPRGLDHFQEYSKGKATRSVRLRYINWGAKERQQALSGAVVGDPSIYDPILLAFVNISFS